MNNGTVYKLAFPFEWPNASGEKVEVTELKIARPKGKHLKKLGADTSLGNVMQMMHHLTDYTDKFFDEIDGADYMAVAEIVMGFLDNGRETGEE